jgi:hypothetical protein
MEALLRTISFEHNLSLGAMVRVHTGVTIWSGTGQEAAQMTDDEMFERNLELQTAFMRYILDQPDILDQLPDDFRLIILPDDDPELGQRNLELLGGQGDSDRPVVIARMRTRRPLDLRIRPPQVFVPVTAAAG